MPRVFAFIAAALVVLVALMARPVSTAAPVQPAPLDSRSSVVSQPAPAAPPATAYVAAGRRPTPPPAAPWQVIPASQMPSIGTGAGAGQPVFRGGRKLRGPITGSGGGSAPKTPAATSGLKAATFYNGLNAAGIAASDNPLPQYPTPPDSTGAKGPNDYVEITNSVIHVWDSNLHSVQSATLSSFVGVSNPYCDPQVQWDQTANRWLFSFLLCNSHSSSPQDVVYGWSKTSDPSMLAATAPQVNPDWCVFAVNTAPYLLDFTKLGHNANFLIFAGNAYDMRTPSNTTPVSAVIIWAPLPGMGDTSCTAPKVSNTALSPALKTGDGVTPAFTPVPVNTDTAATDGYIVAAYDPAGNVQSAGTRNKLAVWHLDSSGALHQDPDLVVPSYDAPPVAQQQGGFPIDTLDARLTQAVGDPVTGIWTQHTVANGGASKVTWYELALVGPNLAVIQHGDVTNGNDFIFNAAISPSLSARGAMIEYTRSSSSMFPVIEVQVRSAGTPAGQMAPGSTIEPAGSVTQDADSSCNYQGQGLPCRWGDYSGASPDPAQPYAVWGTNELITAATSQPAWQDDNFAFFAAVRPLAPAPVSAAPASGGATVSWTPSTFDTGAPDSSYIITVYSGNTVVSTTTVSAPATGTQITGLPDGCYTFTVTPTNVAGVGAESAHTNAVAVGRATCPGLPAGTPRPRDPAQPGPTPTSTPGR